MRTGSLGTRKNGTRCIEERQLFFGKRHPEHHRMPRERLEAAYEVEHHAVPSLAVGAQLVPANVDELAEACAEVVGRARVQRGQRSDVCTDTAGV